MTPALARVVNAAALPALAALAAVDIAAGTLRFWREVRQEARAFIAAVAGEES